MYSLGIDFGSNAVRVLLADLTTYKVMGTAEVTYSHVKKEFIETPIMKTLRGKMRMIT